MKRRTSFPVCGALICLMAFMACNDGNPTGPTFNASQIIGTWILDRNVYSWDVTENGLRSQGSATDTFAEVVVVTASTITWYDVDEYGNCFYVSATPYTLSGNRLLGDEFVGVDTLGGDVDSYSATLGISQGQLVVTVRDEYSGTTVTGWESDAYYYDSYTGAVPPATWPQQQCLARRLGRSRESKLK